MAKGRTTGRKPGPTRVLSQADVERMLDDFEGALLGGDGAAVPGLVERLWQVRSRLPEPLTRRLIDGRTQVPGLLLELLGGFAGGRARTYFRRIAESRDAPDITRFGAQRRAGWPERGEAKKRRAFLETLRDADGTLVEAVEQGTEGWPPSGDVLQEVVGYLLALPAARQRALIERAVEGLGARAAWLLYALLHVDGPEIQRLALGELVRLRAPGAAGPIGRLGKTTRHPDLRAEAGAAVQRLGLQVVDRRAPAESLPLPPIDRALLSLVDGDGGQVILVVRRLQDGPLLMADIFWNDHWGIKSAFGASRAAPDVVEEIVEGLEDEGIALVEADLAAVRGVLAAALEVNAASGHGLPPEFELWEPLVHDAYPPPSGEPLAVPELDDGPYLGRRELVRSSGRLADHPFFESWGFDAASTSYAMLGTPPPSGSRWTDRQYRPLIEQLVDSGAGARLRQRLRRQAWVLEQDGDTEARDLALATAAQLAGADSADLVKQPFLRRLVERSVMKMIGAMFSGI
jgi:hypothetical protein